MATHQGKPLPDSSIRRPSYLLATIIIAIFFAEAVIMVMLNLLPPLEVEQDVLLDAISLIIILSPILYYFAFKPLQKEILVREKAEKELKKIVEELNKALEEVKTLQGIIPICSSCKNIRNDQGFWEKVESYIGGHTDAKFSHGVCPDCAKKLYPELNE
jgi:hypothetical protein